MAYKAAMAPDSLASARLWSNPFRPRRPAVLDVHELIHGQARQRDADRLPLQLGLTYRRPPRDRKVAPRIGAVRRPALASA
jgi:hypothetical protein